MQSWTVRKQSEVAGTEERSFAEVIHQHFSGRQDAALYPEASGGGLPLRTRAVLARKS